MPDSIVSVRVPSSLVIAMKKKAEDAYFKDMSELVRSIIRKKMVGIAMQPSATVASSREQLIQELEIIVTRLKEMDNNK